MDKTRSGIKGRFFPEKRHDKYREKEKRRTGAVCTGCGAVYDSGRWTWQSPLIGAEETVCPACLRIEDMDPAGTIRVSGKFFTGHRDEILNLIRNIEDEEKKEHPLERIIGIVKSLDGMVVTTTGIHVARRIGEALQHSFQGDYSLIYEKGETGVQIDWKR